MNFNSAIPIPSGNGGGISNFDRATAAPEFQPIPPGVYTARVVKGEYTTAKTGSEVYRLKFEITDGPQAGNTLIRMFFFSEKAIGYSKRDLAPFGLTSTAQLLSPFPDAGREYLVRLVVALQVGDDGIRRNDIKRIDVVKVTDSPAAAFLLPPPTEGGPK